MNESQELYKGECIIDSLGFGCSNTPLEHNNKPSKKHAQEEQIFSEPGQADVDAIIFLSVLCCCLCLGVGKYSSETAIK